MAFAAMRQGLGEIGAAVPLRRLRGVRRKPGVGIEHKRPERHRPALIIRERQRIGTIGRMRGRQAEEIGLDRERIRIRHIGVGGIGHRRIEPGPVLADAALDGVEKFLIAVVADPGIFIGA